MNSILYLHSCILEPFFWYKIASEDSSVSQNAIVETDYLTIKIMCCYLGNCCYKLWFLVQMDKLLCIK